MTDLKIIEMGVFRAYWKICGVVLAIYGVAIAGYFAVKKLKERKRKKDSKSGK